MYPASLKVSAADMAAGPAPMITIFLLLSTLFSPRTALSGFFYHPTFGTETTTLPFFLSTGKVFSPSMIGPCSGCPVLISNPALCKGHINLSPTSSPFANENPKCAHLD